MINFELDKGQTIFDNQGDEIAFLSCYFPLVTFYFDNKSNRTLYKRFH